MVSAAHTAKDSCRSVSFGTVQVREYERQVDTTMYLGLGLGGWDYYEKPITTVDRHSEVSTRKDKSEVVSILKTKPHHRYSIYMQYGYTRKEIQKAMTKKEKVLLVKKRS